MTRPIDIAVLISGGGTTLLNLARCIDQGRLPARIVAVVCSNDHAAGLQRAAEIGLPATVINPRRFADRDQFASALWSHLRQSGAQLVCLAGYLTLLPIAPDFTGRVMNIHPALLPSFGGPGMYGHHVHQAVLDAGCKVSGCTVHFADQHYDHGPIIIQRCCPVLEDDTPQTLAARVFKEECIAYPQAIDLFAQGRLTIDRGRVRIAPPPA